MLHDLDSLTFPLPAELRDLLLGAPSVTIYETTEELFRDACGTPPRDVFEVAYDLPDGQSVVEASVVRLRNGLSVNYPEPYMRRRDPECMVIADDLPSDKPHLRERFDIEFAPLRQATFEWLATQDLAIFFFSTGYGELGRGAVAVAPANAGFFALGLALLQDITPLEDLPDGFTPGVVLYVAPPFRHTHFGGRQAVVHHRADALYEIYSYNLYPGPSAKKGIYGTLIRQGEIEGWVTAHCSAVQVITPYDNVVTIMHEGASGGGKSEMLEQPHRLPDGRLLKGRNLVTGEERFLEIPRTCDLNPICDDMAMCHPSIQRQDGRLWLLDAESAWFVRVNHITEYGTDHDLEALTINPAEPLLFFNIDAQPNSRALIWEHTLDAPDVRCPNPRVIVPRRIIPNALDHEAPVDIRSMGIRTPPCTREQPSYGILGIFHMLPPALAWLWRLTAPRGHDNPSILDTEEMTSEGVGSYWPFASGLFVEHANLLLEQFEATPQTRYALTPNQHIGAWRTGFMPQWLMRDYLARRGTARFAPSQLTPARCTLLGYAVHNMRIEGIAMAQWFLEVQTQPEVGEEGYDAGAAMLDRFFRQTLQRYLTSDLRDQAHRIIECCLDGGSLEQYEAFFPEARGVLIDTDHPGHKHP